MKKHFLGLAAAGLAVLTLASCASLNETEAKASKYMKDNTSNYSGWSADGSNLTYKTEASINVVVSIAYTYSFDFKSDTGSLSASLNDKTYSFDFSITYNYDSESKDGDYKYTASNVKNPDDNDLVIKALDGVANSTTVGLYAVVVAAAALYDASTATK